MGWWSKIRDGLLNSIVDAVTGGLNRTFQIIDGIITGHLSKAIEGAIRLMSFVTMDPFGHLINSIIFEEAFKDKIKSVTEAGSYTYNLIADRTPNNARTEFVLRTVIEEQDIMDSMYQSLFNAGAYNFNRFIIWSNKNNIHQQLGYKVSTQVSFDNFNFISGSDPALDIDDFAPVLPLRVFTLPVYEENFPEYHKLLTKISKKAFNNDKKVIKDLIKAIDESTNAQEIDFAFLFWGIAINRPEKSCKEYMWKFLDLLIEKDALIPLSGYNTSFNGRDAEFYEANHLYGQINGEYKVKLNAVNTGKGITFYCDHEVADATLATPFQWRISWGSLVKRENIGGTLEGKFDISGSKTEAKIIMTTITAPIAIAIIETTEDRVVGQYMSGDTYFDEYHTFYIYNFVYVIKRTNWYVGSYRYGASNVAVSLLAEDGVPQSVNEGWCVLSEVQKELLVKQGVISGNPKKDALERWKDAFPEISDNGGFSYHPVDADGEGNSFESYNKISISGFTETELTTLTELVDDTYTEQTMSGDTYVDIDYTVKAVPKVPFYQGFVFKEEEDNTSTEESEDITDKVISKMVDVAITGSDYKGELHTPTKFSNKYNPYNALLSSSFATVSVPDILELPAGNTVIFKRKAPSGQIDEITVTNLYVTNYCLDTFPVNFDAVDGLNWTDGESNGFCPVLFPFHRSVFKSMNIMDRNECLQLMHNVIFNWFVISEYTQKWYMRKWVRPAVIIVMIVVTVVVSIFTYGSGSGPMYALSTAIVGALGLVGTTAMIVSFVIQLIMSMVIQLLVTKIITKATGNELLGQIFGMIAVIGLNAALSGGFSTMTTNLMKDFCTPSNLTKLGLQGTKALAEYYTNKESKKILGEYEDFMNQKAQDEDLLRKNQEQLNMVRNNFTLTNSSAIVRDIIFNPYLGIDVLYGSSDSKSIYDNSQNIIYNMYDIVINTERS